MAGLGTTRFEPETLGVDDVAFEVRKRRLRRGLNLEGLDGEMDPFLRRGYRRLEGPVDDGELLEEALRARRARKLREMGLGETMPEPAGDAREKAHAILGDASQVRGGVPDAGLAEWHARFKARKALADRAQEDDFWDRANAARARWARENRSFYQRKADAREEQWQAQMADAERADRRAALEGAMRQDMARRRLFAEMEAEQAKREEAALNRAHELDLEQLKGSNAFTQAMELEKLKGRNALEQENVKGAHSYRQAMGVEGVRGANARDVANVNAQARVRSATVTAEGVQGAQARKEAQANADAREKAKADISSLLEKAQKASFGEIDKHTEQMIDWNKDLTAEQKQDMKMKLRADSGKNPKLAEYYLRLAYEKKLEIGEELSDEVIDSIVPGFSTVLKGTKAERGARTEAEAVGGEAQREQILREAEVESEKRGYGPSVANRRWGI